MRATPRLNTSVARDGEPEENTPETCFLFEASDTGHSALVCVSAEGLIA